MKAFTRWLLLIVFVSVTALSAALDVKSPFIPLQYDGFTVHYDAETYQPRVVYYTLTADDALNDPPNKRPSSFHRDDRLVKQLGSNKVPTHADYTNSGYDRGHLACADDFDDNQERLNGTFVTSNISPQVPHLNQHGAWRRSELYGKDLAIRYDSVTIVCGPLFMSVDHKYIGSTRRIPVPEAFFKLFIFKDEGFNHIEAYIIPNEAGTVLLNDYEVDAETLYQLLRLSGIQLSL